MIPALQKITEIVCLVQSLEWPPSAGINAISVVLEAEANREEREARLAPAAGLPATMSKRAWLAVVALALFAGLITGWTARTSTTSDRYLTGLAERHHAEARYYNRKTDQMVNDNERKYGK